MNLITYEVNDLSNGVKYKLIRLSFNSLMTFKKYYRIHILNNFANVMDVCVEKWQFIESAEVLKDEWHRNPFFWLLCTPRLSRQNFFFF